MVLGYPRCPKCGKVMSKGEMPRQPDGSFSCDTRWYCSECQTEQIMGVVESIELERKRKKALWDLRGKFKEFYNR